MTVLAVCTVVFLIVVVRDTLSEERFCRGCGGTCLTFEEAVTTEEVVPCSLWKKDDILERRGEERWRGGGEEREGRSRGETTSVLDCFSSERKAQEIEIASHLKINQSMYDYVSSHLRNRRLSPYRVDEGSHLEAITSFCMIDPLSFSGELKYYCSFV